VGELLGFLRFYSSLGGGARFLRYRCRLLAPYL
jgi:hypothetical protein